MKELLNLGLRSASTHLYQILNKAEISEDCKKNILQEFNYQCAGPSSYFDGLMTYYKQDKYYKDNFSLVEPKEICIGHSSVVGKQGYSRQRKLKSHFLYYISLQSTLKALYGNQRFRELLSGDDSQGNNNNDDELNDFIDGTVCKTHPVFQDLNALRLIFYYDDLELRTLWEVERVLTKLGCFTSVF